MFRSVVCVLVALGIIGLSVGSTPVSAASVTAWWPENNASIDGTQPFKAMVENMSVDNYEMFWQVDGGQLNRMSNDNTDYPHKEVDVNVDSWNWDQNGEYEVTFVAKNLNGHVIDEKNVKVRVPKSDSVSSTRSTETETDTAKRTSTRSNQDQDIEVQSPSNNSRVSGTKTFKAVLSNTSANDYRMYWQVDNGQLNEMTSVTSVDSHHKESSVNFDGWNWNGSGPYEVRFVAKSNNGEVIDRKTVSIRTEAADSVTPISPTPVNPITPVTPAPIIPTPTTPPAPPTVPPTPNSGNPLSGMSFFVDPNNPAKNQADQWRSSRPEDARLMDKIASQPGARWFGNWNSSIGNDVDAYVDAAAAQNQVPVMITYNIPQRDCGHYSAGGLGSPEAYKSWIRTFANAIGSRQAVVILEPDALTLTSCLSANELSTRNDLIKDSIEVFKSLGNTKVYVDAGHSNWLPAADIANRLVGANVAIADGFALNTSNFERTADLISYGTTVSGLVGGKHFVLDTSRNGLGANGQWCNPDGRALGAQVTTQTGNPLVDAFLWLKVPGESDGTCNGGPSAGVWWPEFALGLARRAAY